MATMWRVVSSAMRMKMCRLMKALRAKLNVGSCRRMVRMEVMMMRFRSLRRVSAKNGILVVEVWMFCTFREVDVADVEVEMLMSMVQYCRR